mgnify:CR=1 FL=1
MLTPSYSSDCANSAHAAHEAYARTHVVAFWRMMATERRHRLLEAATADGGGAVDRRTWGGTRFQEAFAHAGGDGSLDRFLGVRDLYEHFEGRRDTRQRDVVRSLRILADCA